MVPPIPTAVSATAMVFFSMGAAGPRRPATLTSLDGMICSRAISEAVQHGAEAQAWKLRLALSTWHSAGPVCTDSPALQAHLKDGI